MAWVRWGTRQSISTNDGWTKCASSEDGNHIVSKFSGQARSALPDPLARHDRQTPHSISPGGSMANAFPLVSRIGVCAAMQTRGCSLHSWDDPNLSGEEPFRRAGPIGTDH